MPLENKTVIVTGASSGIGAAAARLFAAKGANLVLGARRAPRLEAIAAEIAAAGGRAIIVAGDAGEAAFADRLVTAATTTFGGLDAAFNNVGDLGDLGPVEHMSTETWRRVLAVNLDSAFFAARAQIPALRTRGCGSMVFTSSFVGHATAGLPGMAAYAAAKSGLVGLARALAAELGPEGVRANALLPGGTKTEMAGADPETKRFIAGLHALKRMAAPEEIAEAALFLLSDAASFVTGAAFVADGGASIAQA